MVRRTTGTLDRTCLPRAAHGFWMTVNKIPLCTLLYNNRQWSIADRRYVVPNRNLQAWHEPYSYSLPKR
jgi:hypothetical protein